jgi:hypothetical protein
LNGGPFNSLTVRFLVVIAPAFLDRRCATVATDGDLGKVDDFNFDDESWTIR